MYIYIYSSLAVCVYEAVQMTFLCCRHAACMEDCARAERGSAVTSLALLARQLSSEEDGASHRCRVCQYTLVSRIGN